MVDLQFLLIIATVSFFASAFLTRAVVMWLNNRNLMDVPNARSSHSIPTPRGGGWGVMPVIWLAWGYLTYQLPPSNLRFLFTIIIGISFVLSLFSWIDDYRKDGLSPLFRLIAQAIGVAIPLIVLPYDLGILTETLGFPVWLDRIVIFFGWLWFINAFNFMDGINGISGIETFSIASGIVILTALFSQQAALPVYAIIMAGSALGFLIWNLRTKALVFLGDIGSIGLGYSLGWLLILMGVNGHWEAIIVLPLLYWLDATYTLITRFFQGKTLWEAHREHIYQKLADRLSHVKVSLLFFVINICILWFFILYTYIP